MSLEDLKEVSKTDKQYQKLIETIKNQSFAETVTLEEGEIRPFFNVRKSLSVLDGVVMYGFEGKIPRVLIPSKLRQLVIRNLHSANQGSTGLLSRAQESVYWPGMDKNIHDHVHQCKQCQYSAPSQPKELLILSEIPIYPFQHVVTDLFDSHNHMYLAYADRLAGFIELAHFPTSTSSSVIIDTLVNSFTDGEFRRKCHWMGDLI